MAEPPGSWDLLTASLALSDLSRPFTAWAFLVLQGLVRDEPGDRERFAEVVREESAVEITGPTVARRVALRLDLAGLARGAARTPDPWGVSAARRLEAVEGWTGGSAAREYQRRLGEAGLPGG